MQQRTYDPTQNIKKLTDDELSRLFHVCKENADLFLKLLPGHPWLELVRKNPDLALKGLVYFRDQP